MLQTLNETIEFLPSYEVKDHNNLTKFSDKVAALELLHHVVAHIRDMSILRSLLMKEGNGVNVCQLDDHQMLEVLADHLFYGRIKVKRTPKLSRQATGAIPEQQYMTPREVEQMEKTRREERRTIPQTSGLDNSSTDKVIDKTNKATKVSNELVLTGDPKEHEKVQAQLFSDLHGGGGTFDFPKAFKGVEGKFVSPSGEEIFVSLKDFSGVKPEKLFNFRSKINENIWKVQEVIDEGLIDESAELLFSVRQASSSQVVEVLNMRPTKKPVTTFERLQNGPFKKVYFEANDGVFSLDLKTGKPVKVK